MVHRIFVRVGAIGCIELGAWGCGLDSVVFRFIGFGAWCFGTTGLGFRVQFRICSVGITAFAMLVGLVRLVGLIGLKGYKEGPLEGP